MSATTIQAGVEFAGTPYLLDLAAAEAYTRGCENPPRRKPAAGIHDDPERAHRAGFKAPIAAGEHTLAIAAQMLVERFGASFTRGGSLEAAFVKPVLFGDTITPRARVLTVDHGKAELDLWVENQDGARVMVGRARVRTSS